MPGNFTASYKIYFLKAVFDAAVSGESCVGYDRLAASMVASAWYPVLFFRLNLGATDQLARVCTRHTRGWRWTGRPRGVTSWRRP